MLTFVYSFGHAGYCKQKALQRNITFFPAIVRFDVGYDVELSGVKRSIDFSPVPQELFDHQKMIIRGESLDEGKKITFFVRGVDAVESFAQDNVTVMVDLSPPVVENLWITKGDILNLSVHNVLELSEIT